MHNFEGEYRKLNDKQRAAVDSIEGPLLVIAGPGTGKTQLLSMRVANILIQTDASPQNILCLTFTNKAAVNMRERLVSLIGAEAHAVNVQTFHSFAANTMAEFPDYFWSGARLSAAPDAVLLSVIQELLQQLPLDSPLAMRYSGSFTAISDVQNALKLAKEAGLTPEKLRTLINANTAYIDLIEPQLADILGKTLSFKKLDELREQLASLPSQQIDQLITPLLSLDTVIKESLDFATTQDKLIGKTTHTGAWKRRWLQTIDGHKGMYSERRRNAWWLELAGVYSRYQQELSARGYYDYADMLVQVISQLEQSGDLRSQVQEQTLYVLIDEFQDTNAAQLRLAHLVADHEVSNQQPNLMAVGDDDQSIFKFNGAELNNMLSFRRSYPSSKLLVLTDNYRSNQAVLDTAQKVIEQASDRLVKREPALSKDLSAVNPPRQSGIIQHQIYPTQEHQLSMLAEEIARRRRDYPEETIAVLARKHSSLRAMAANLLEQQIEVRYEQQQNILEHEAIQQIILLSDVTLGIAKGDIPAVNHALSLLLRHPAWKIPANTLWRLAQANYSQANWLDTILGDADLQLQKMGTWLMWLAQESSHQPLSVMIEYLLGLRPSATMSSPLNDYFITGKPTSVEYIQSLSAIRLLRSLVHEFCIGSNPILEDFCKFIELHQSNSKVITDYSWFVSGINAVELLTVHKAKGLEFDTVYIIDAVESNWQPRKAGRKPPSNLPMQPYGDDYDDYVRLMYVAITRAKHSVILTSYSTDLLGDTVLPTPLIHLIPSAQLATITEQDSIRALTKTLTWPRLESSDERQLLHDQLEHYQLSVTGLLNFLDVTSGGPRYFFERNILRLPEAKTPSAAFGTAMHSALEAGQKLTNTSKFNLHKVHDAYQEALRNEHIPQADHERYIAHGQKTIEYLFKELGYTFATGNKPEQVINNIRLAEACIGGRMDRIDLQDNSAIIIDYKTGKPVTSFKTKDKNKEVKVWKHKTQLIFYSLLLKNSPRYSRIKNLTGQMVYVEAETTKELTQNYIATQEELDQLNNLIQKVWLHIMSLNFPDTDKYPPGMSGIQKFIDELLNDKI